MRKLIALFVLMISVRTVAADTYNVTTTDTNLQSAALYGRLAAGQTWTGTNAFSGTLTATAAGTVSNALNLGGVAAENYAQQATAEVVVTLTNSMSTAEWQAAIDAVPKEGNGQTLRINVGAGTMTLTNTIFFRGLRYSQIFIDGASATASLNSNQTSIINGAAGKNALQWFGCVGETYLRYLKISCVSTSAVSCVYVRNSNFVYAQYCWFTGSSTTAGYGIYAYGGSMAQCYLSYFSNINIALFANQNSQVWSSGNSYTGTQPTYGHYSSALIWRDDATVVGATDNAKAGGQISLSSGAWF